MLLTLSPAGPFQQHPHATARDLPDFLNLPPEAMGGPPPSSSSASSSLLPLYPSSAPSSQLNLAPPLPSPRGNQPPPAPSKSKRKRSEDLAADARPTKRHAVESEAPATNPDSPDAQARSPDMDKKRNKLGYHRTSVACSHCRRRKIRCMLPDNDSTGRCANCIRLKKDCTFCPVEESGTSRGPRAQVLAAATKNQSPEAMLKSNQLPPNVAALQSRPPFVSPGEIPPGGLGIYGSPQSAVQDQSQWFSPHPGWDRSAHIGDPESSANYNLSHHPLVASYPLPSSTPQMHQQMPPDLTPHSEDGHIPHSANPYVPNLNLRTDLPWAPTPHSVHSSRSLSHVYPQTMSPQPALEASSVPRRAATLPGPLPPLGYGGSATPSTISEPMSLPTATGRGAMMGPEWQQVDWTMQAPAKDATYATGQYGFDPSWYQQQPHGSGPPPPPY